LKYETNRKKKTERKKTMGEVLRHTMRGFVVLCRVSLRNTKRQQTRRTLAATNGAKK